MGGNDVTVTTARALIGGPRLPDRLRVLQYTFYLSLALSRVEIVEVFYYYGNFHVMEPKFINKFAFFFLNVADVSFFFFTYNSVQQ